MRLLGMFVVCCTVGATSLTAQAVSESPFVDLSTATVREPESRVVFEPRTLGSRITQPIKAENTAVRFAKLLVPTTLGALAGSAAGYKAGDAIGLGGTESDGLQSAVLLGTAGGLLGTAAGSYLVLRSDITTGQLTHGVAIGALGGILGAALVGTATDSEWNGTGVWLGFGLGQGIITSFILSQVAGR